MSKQSNDIIVHSTPGGKLYIKEEEFFANEKVRELLSKLLKSNLYKAIKESQSATAVRLRG